MNILHMFLLLLVVGCAWAFRISVQNTLCGQLAMWRWRSYTPKSYYLLFSRFRWAAHRIVIHAVASHAHRLTHFVRLFRCRNKYFASPMLISRCARSVVFCLHFKFFSFQSSEPARTHNCNFSSSLRVWGARRGPPSWNISLCIMCVYCMNCRECVDDGGRSPNRLYLSFFVVAQRRCPITSGVIDLPGSTHVYNYFMIKIFAALLSPIRFQLAVPSPSKFPLSEVKQSKLSQSHQLGVHSIRPRFHFARRETRWLFLPGASRLCAPVQVYFCADSTEWKSIVNSESWSVDWNQKK